MYIHSLKAFGLPCFRLRLFLRQGVDDRIVPVKADGNKSPGWHVHLYVKF